MAAGSMWERYKTHRVVHPNIGLWMDISRMKFGPRFFDEMSAPIERAFDAMAALEKGDKKACEQRVAELERERAVILERIRKEVKAKYGVTPNLTDPQPLPGVEFGYALNIGRCVGCRKCVYACVKENNQSRDPQIQYIRVLQMRKGSIDVETSSQQYEGEVPKDGFYYMPVQCHQCRKAPCVKACPVKATWQEPDGVIVVDYNWCIGCRYCMAACPYGARHFNWGEPGLPAAELNPKTHYMGNRPRPKGVVEKCTFCVQRVRAGRYPACVEACPVGARKFGNLLDPNSEIRYVIENKRVLVLKEELNTMPKFFYFYGT